jgi:uncharacterized protein (DUF608 family)
MIKYSSKEVLDHGIPLGGIGAGKVELNNKGKMVNLTIFNNWQRPVTGMRGFHVFVMGDKPYFLEDDVMIKGLGHMSTLLTYEGEYPFVRISGGNAQLTAFTPIIRNDLMDSSLPAFGLTVKAKGIIAISIANLVGSFLIGRKNVPIKNGFKMVNVKSNDYDPAKGDMSFICDSGKVIHQYNINLPPQEVLKNGWVKELYESPEPWLRLIDGNLFPQSKEASGMWDDFAGMVISQDEVKCVLSWYFNNPTYSFPYTHYYSNFFKDSEEVARYFLEKFDELEKKTIRFPDRPFGEILSNSAYILSSSTWLTKDSRFGIMEAPEALPLLNTIGGLTYDAGSLPVLYLFPELERKVIEMFLKAIREDGYVPHDLGYLTFEAPSDGTTAPPEWKDTNLTLILEVYRYYKVTRDNELLREFYPYILKVFSWLRDKVPLKEGSGDDAFDVNPVIGYDSYITSMTYVASKAMEKMAELVGDKDTAERARRLSETSLKELRWNGKFYEAWEEPRTDALFLGQFIAFWWAELLDLPYDKDKIRTALREAYNRIKKGKLSCCVPNAINPDGSPYDYSPQTTGSWIRLVFATATLGYWLGLEEWNEILELEWKALIERGMVWNQPSRLNVITGFPDVYLDHYIGSPVVWGILVKEINTNRD